MIRNELDGLLQKMIELDASDLHLNHGAKISYRIHGIVHQTGPIILGQQIFQLALYALDGEQTRRFHEERKIDFSYKIQHKNGEETRFRGCMVLGQGEPSCVFRKIDGIITPLEQLGLPAIVTHFAEHKQGLILVSGPTNSGKSTTMASIVDYINENNPYHIVTIEDPLEYIHQNKKSIVTHREIGRDVNSFKDAAIDVLRLDPNVILLGELRDAETMSAAITNAGTGHLVISTVHTNNAPLSIMRIVDEFPVEQRDSIRSQLASNLIGVVNQRLFPNPKGKRTAVHEVMAVDEEISELIRNDETRKIHAAMEGKKDKGNLLMKDSIAEAKEKGNVYPNVIWK